MDAAKQSNMYPIVNNSTNVMNEPIPGGFYIKARCIQDSAIAIAAPHVREIWDWLIKEANHKPKKTHGTTINRGQVFTDYNEIIEGLMWREGFIKKGYKKHHVDYAMRWLRQEQMITTQKTTRGLIITICKYDYYQNPANYERDKDYDNQKTGLRQPAATIHKNDKNIKNDKKEIERGTPSHFYLNEIEANGKHLLIEKYKTLVAYLHGENDEDIFFESVLKMEQQLTFKQYLKLREKAQTGIDMRDILKSMENDKKALRDKKSMYSTINTWANIRLDRQTAKK